MRNTSKLLHSIGADGKILIEVDETHLTSCATNILEVDITDEERLYSGKV